LKVCVKASMSSTNIQQLTSRLAPLEMTAEQFRSLGHDLVDRIAGFLASIPARPVTPAEPADQVRAALDASRALPENGHEPDDLLQRAADLLFDHSLLNGHPRFFGYITSSAAPIGMLAELLAAAVNANVGAWKLSPMATEMEVQVIRWLAQFIGYPADCGGLLLSGGNMANITCFIAARAAQAGWDIRKQGVAGGGRLLVYASSETHTWIQKAADLTGLGTDSVRWISADARQRIDLYALEIQYQRDIEDGYQPFLVVGSAGTVSTGAVDPLPQLAEFCKDRSLWFHVDAAYGAFAAGIPGAPAELKGLTAADSVALDPHKWLFAPLEAGCALVRNPAALRNAFSYHPPYYSFDTEAMNFYDIGPQNSRGFRALKIWLSLQHAGAAAYREMIQDQIRLAWRLYELALKHPELEAITHNLSITTMRYVPLELRATIGSEQTEAYLNRLNQLLLAYLEKSGEAFASNAQINGKYALRFCIVNFRTAPDDIEAMPQLLVRLGRQAHADLDCQPERLM